MRCVSTAVMSGMAIGLSLEIDLSRELVCVRLAGIRQIKLKMLLIGYLRWRLSEEQVCPETHETLSFAGKVDVLTG